MAENNTQQSTDFETQIVETLKSNPNGVTQSILEKSVPNMTVHELAPILNKLSSQGKIELLQKKKQLVYALKDKTSDKKSPKNADVEEKVVYEAVERAGSNGTTAKDIRFSTNLGQAFITRLLKSMESKRLVKAVVSSSKKKVFMLYGLEPSHTVTGGLFYSGQEFESEFVAVLSDQCYRYLLQAKGIAEKLSDPLAQRKASFKSSQDICNYINSLKISKVELKISDIEKILESLTFDAKVEKSTSCSALSSKETENFYKVYQPLVSGTALMRMPCGVCQIFRDCGKGHEVSPSTCVYLKEWLDF